MDTQFTVCMWRKVWKSDNPVAMLQCLYLFYSPGVAPTFTSKPTIKQAGGKLLLECNLSAAPEPSIKWFKDEVGIQSSGRWWWGVGEPCGGEIHSGADVICNCMVCIRSANGPNYSAFNTLTPWKSVCNCWATEQQLIFKDCMLWLKSVLPCKFDDPEYDRILDSCFIYLTERFNVVMKKTAANIYYLALEISNVSATDQAVYKVNARNSFGESNASIKLNFAQGRLLHLQRFMMITFTCSAHKEIAQFY